MQHICLVSDTLCVSDILSMTKQQFGFAGPVLMWLTSCLHLCLKWDEIGTWLHKLLVMFLWWLCFRKSGNISIRFYITLVYCYLMQYLEQEWKQIFAAVVFCPIVLQVNSKPFLTPSAIICCCKTLWSAKQECFRQYCLELIK